MHGSHRQLSLSPRSRRAAFTLIELLIVIAVLALLISLVISVARGVIGSAKAAATKATMQKVNDLLMKRVAAFERYCDAQDKLASSVSPSYVSRKLNYNVYQTVRQGYQALGGTGEIPDSYWASNSIYRPALLLLARKAYFKQMFPQSLAELRMDTSWPSDDEELGKINTSGSTEHAEVLYLSLTKLDSFGVEATAIDQFKSDELKDTDGNGIPEFIDGWGNPIRFYRWPTRLVRPALTASSYSNVQSLVGSDMTPHHDWNYTHPIPVGPSYDSSGASYALLVSAPPSTTTAVTRGPSTTLEAEHADPLAKDPSDPRNRLHPGETLLPANYAQWNAFVQWMELNLHTSDTYHIPLLVSAGIDGELGLLEPTNVSKFGHLAQPDMDALGALLDNITNRNLQPGSK